MAKGVSAPHHGISSARQSKKRPVCSIVREAMMAKWFSAFQQSILATLRCVLKQLLATCPPVGRECQRLQARTVQSAQAEWTAPQPSPSTPAFILQSPNPHI